MGFKGSLYRKIKQKGIKNKKSEMKHRKEPVLFCPSCKKSFFEKDADIRDGYMYCPFCDHTPLEEARKDSIIKVESSRKIKQKKIKFENEFKCYPVVYKGGHTLFLAKTGLLSPMGPVGDLHVKKTMLIFIAGKKFEIEIPIDKIDFSDVKQWVGSRGTQQEAMAYAGAGMPWGSIGAMMKDLFVEIPFIDKNGKKQKPVFEFTNKKSAERFQKWLYKKLPKESEKQAENPLEILKIRYAKGEITKKEYEEMKKDLM